MPPCRRGEVAVTRTCVRIPGTAWDCTASCACSDRLLLGGTDGLHMWVSRSTTRPLSSSQHTAGNLPFSHTRMNACSTILTDAHIYSHKLLGVFVRKDGLHPCVHDVRAIVAFDRSRQMHPVAWLAGTGPSTVQGWRRTEIRRWDWATVYS